MRKKDILAGEWDKLEGFGDGKRFTTRRCIDCEGEFITEVQTLKKYKNYIGEWKEWKVTECGLSSSRDEIFDYINFQVKGVIKYVEESKGVYKKVKEIRENNARDGENI